MEEPIEAEESLVSEQALRPRGQSKSLPLHGNTKISLRSRRRTGLGDRSETYSRFRSLIAVVLLSQPNPAWAGGNLAKWLSTKDSFRTVA